MKNMNNFTKYNKRILCFFVITSIIIIIGIYYKYYMLHNNNKIENFGMDKGLSDDEIIGTLQQINNGNLHYKIDKPLDTGKKSDWKDNGSGIYLFPRPIKSDTWRLYPIDWHNHMSFRWELIYKKKNKNEYYIKVNSKRNYSTPWCSKNQCTDSRLSSQSGWFSKKNELGKYVEIIQNDDNDSDGKVHGVVILGRNLIDGKNHLQYLKNFAVVYLSHNKYYMIDKLAKVYRDDANIMNGTTNHTNTIIRANDTTRFSLRPNLDEMIARKIS